MCKFASCFRFFQACKNRFMRKIIQIFLLQAKSQKTGSDNLKGHLRLKKKLFFYHLKVREKIVHPRARFFEFIPRLKHLSSGTSRNWHINQDFLFIKNASPLTAYTPTNNAIGSNFEKLLSFSCHGYRGVEKKYKF